MVRRWDDCQNRISQGIKAPLKITVLGNNPGTIYVTTF
jgi:hypothetical protein